MYVDEDTIEFDDDISRGYCSDSYLYNCKSNMN